MPQNLPSSCCDFTGNDLLLIRLSAMFDVDLCVTFLNFQYNPKSNDLVNEITPQKLMYHLLPCFHMHFILGYLKRPLFSYCPLLFIN